LENEDSQTIFNMRRIVKIIKFLQKQKPKKIIFVPKKIFNIVV